MTGGPPARDAAYAAYKLALPIPGLFTLAILAGLVMTALTWVLLALHHTVAGILVIFAGGNVLLAAHLSHSIIGGIIGGIIGASLLLVGFAAAGKTLLDVLQWVLIAAAGNLVGGVGLVTLFRVVQARQAVRGNGRHT